MIILVLITSIFLQLVAAFLAVRLMWVTRKWAAGAVLAAAVSLMALRRGFTLYQMAFAGLPQRPDPLTESVALATSLLIVVGLALIAPLFVSLKNSEEALRLNESRLEALWRLSQMTGASLQQIADFALEEGVRLTKSQIGFVGLMDEKESVLTIQSWSRTVMEQCAVRDKPIHYPLTTAGLWGEAVRQRRPIITNDYQASNPYKKGYPRGHVPIKRNLNIPVFDGERIVVVAGVANKDEYYDEGDVRQLTLMMNGMWWLIKRQRAEEARSAEVERWASLTQTCMDGIIANDMQGNIVLFNENAARILGYSPEEVIGKINVREIYPPGLAREVKRKIYDPDFGGAGILENYETVVRHQDGSLIPIWLSARVLYEKGREVGIVGHFRDLRERKRLEEKLLRHERLAALGQMVAHITHEIKNPLLLIGGFVQQLARGKELPEDARRKLTLVRDEVARLEKFLGDLAAYTRPAPTQKVPGDLLALIREVAELMEGAFRAADVTFRLEAPDQVPPFPFDPGQLRQVLINLLKNAVEAMPRGGTLTVGVALQERDVVLTVADTGVGIPPEHLPSLFTPFFSTKEQGTGLGLAISRGLIEQHGGDIAVHSEVGRGTTCTVRLPRGLP
jgi:PAS domain S-box-containing protein